MRFQRDNRGVAGLIGAMLLLGMFFVAFSGYQAYQVPDQNAETEFAHSQDVRDDLTEMQRAYKDSALNDGSRERVTVKLGTRYQTRLLALNPPPVQGQMQTETREVDLKGYESYEVKVPVYMAQYNELEEQTYFMEYGSLSLSQGSKPVLSDQTDGQLPILGLQEDVEGNSIGNEVFEFRAQPIEKIDVDEVTLETSQTEDYWTDRYDVKEFEDGEVTLDTSDTDVIVRDNDNENGEGPLKFKDGSLDEGNSKTLKFSATNTADESVTVTGFSAEVSGAQNVRINNDDSPEVSINPDSGDQGELNQDGPGEGNNNKIKPDGSTYALDQTAKIDSDSRVTIDIRDWEKEGKGDELEFNLKRVETEADADVIVTLEYELFDPQSFYFEDTS